MATAECMTATAEGVMATARVRRQCNATAAMATVMAATTITTATATAVEVTTKMAAGTDNNQLKW